MQSQIERNHLAKGIRFMRKLLQSGRSEPQEELKAHKSVLFWLFAVACALCIAILLRGCEEPAWSAEIPQDKAVKILVGEASNQGYVGMVCVAEVLRHKGSTRGFYGLNAKHSAHEPKWVWKQAEKAWLASKTSNFTHGADHFENIHAFGTPYWVKSCVLTFEYRDHKFYKETL